MSRLTSWPRPTTVAHAHCDIPGGIYDPSEVVLVARTVARMVELIGKLPDGATAVAARSQAAASPPRTTTTRSSTSGTSSEPEGRRATGSGTRWSGAADPAGEQVSVCQHPYS